LGSNAPFTEAKIEAYNQVIVLTAEVGRSKGNTSALPLCVSAVLYFLLQKLRNVQVSDTTDDAMKNYCLIQKKLKEPVIIPALF